MKKGDVYTTIIGLFLFSLLWTGCSKSNDSENSLSGLQISLSAESIKVGENVNLKLTGIDEETIQQMQWDFGDGNTSDGKEVTHQYQEPGTYTISVSVTFDNGKSWISKGLVNVYYPEVSESQRPSIQVSLQKKDYVQICAHRGYWKEAPENSVKSVTLAIKKGLDMIELDVRKSKDGKLVLMHDATIDRTTNGTGKVSKLNYADLSLYFLRYNGTLTEERIPLFKDILSVGRGKIYIDIDVKIDDFTTIYNMVKQYGMLSQTLFTVYDVASAKRMTDLDKRMILLPVIYEMQDLENYLNACKKLTVVQFNSKAFTDAIIAKAFENGIAIFKNIYVNTTITPTSDHYKQVDEMLAKKGSIIQTDYPVELKDYINNK